MRNLFRWDSPIMQKIAMVGNLVVLNFLWLICSLPIVTMGAATTALYYTMFQYQTNDEDAIFRPFFKGFVRNFWQATGIWLILLLVMALMVFNFLYIFMLGGTDLLWKAVQTAVVLVSVIVVLIQAQLLPMLARFEMKTGALFKNSALLTVLHFPSVVMMACLNIIPVVLFWFDTVLFFRLLFLWVGIWFALIAYANTRILLKIWKRHMVSDEEEAAKEEIPEETGE